MLVLAILGIFAAVGGAGWGLWRFNAYADNRFNHHFFTITSFVAIIGSAVLVAGGRAWWANAQESGSSDPWNGIILMVLGSAGAIALLVRNVWRTNILVGLAGTALQACIFSAVATVGLVSIGISTAGAVLSAVFLVGTPVYILNK